MHGCELRLAHGTSVRAITVGSMTTPTVEQLSLAMARLMEAVTTANQTAHMAAETAAAAGRPVEGRKPDTRHLEKPRPFAHPDLDAEQREWPEYRFQLTNFLVGLDPGFADELERVEANREDELDIETMDTPTRERTYQLYSFLGGLMRGRLLAQVRGVPHRNEFEAWRRLLNMMEPVARGRSLGLLQHLVGDSYWAGGTDFQTQLLKWERAVDEYQRVSGRDFPPELKVATVLRHSPAEIRTHLLLRVTDTTTYLQLRALVVEYLQANRNYAEQFADSRADDPMEVGQVKGKGKDVTCNKCGKKGHFARDCWSLDKGKGSKGRTNNGKMSEAKGNGKGKSTLKGGKIGKGSTENFGGECYTCGRKGHLARD